MAKVSQLGHGDDHNEDGKVSYLNSNVTLFDGTRLSGANDCLVFGI